ncbi:Exosome RNA helicase MTR4 [Dinochytrium kinnereticum]|nr:Exosome RNA helicase MTR4 [Dinochytrium kinnereticum]
MILSRNYHPVIVFSFSKRECEANALQVSKLQFNEDAEQAMVSSIFNNAIQVLNEDDRNLPQIEHLLPLLKRGIGIHHSGLLPILKEVIEILFQEGLIKVLFATETFSIGLNMPAKTVVFTSVTKFDGKQSRFLSGGEYIQMSGRAGRRGLDDRGIVILMIDSKIEPAVATSMLKGESDRLDSAFHLTYNMILNLLRIEGISAEYILERSFFQYQSVTSLPTLRRDVEILKQRLEHIQVEQEEVIEEYYNLRLQLESYRQDVRDVVNHERFCLPFLQAGRLVRIQLPAAKSDEDDSVPKEPLNFGWGMIVNIQKRIPQQKSMDLTEAVAEVKFVIDVLLHCAPGTDANAPLPCPPDVPNGEMLIVPCALSSMDGLSSAKLFPPKDLKSADSRNQVRKMIREIEKRFLAQGGIPMLDPQEDLGITDVGFTKLLQKISALEDKLAENPLANSPDLPAIYEKYTAKVQVMHKLRSLKKKVKDTENVIQLDDLKCRRRVLRRLGFTSQADVIEVKGRVACEVSVGDELLLTEMMFNGVFGDLTVEQCVALLSCFCHQERTKEKSGKELNDELAKPFQKLRENARNIAKISIECKLALDESEYMESFRPELMEVVFEWCKGAKFAAICKMTDAFEGSIIRTFRMLEELLRQMVMASKSIGNTELESKFADVKQAVAKNADEILSKLVNVKPSGRGIVSVKTTPLHGSNDKETLEDIKENSQTTGLEGLQAPNAKAKVIAAELKLQSDHVDAMQENIIVEKTVKDRASLLRQNISVTSSKELTPSITALKRRGTVEDSRVEVLVKQYNQDTRSIIKAPANLASIFENIATNAALKRTRSAHDDSDSGNHKPASLPSALQKPSKIYRPSISRQSPENSPPGAYEQKRPDFVVPRSSPPLVTSTGLTMPISFVQKKKATPSPTGRNKKVSPNSGLKSGPRRIPVKNSNVHPKEEIKKPEAVVSSFTFVEKLQAPDIADVVFGNAVVPPSVSSLLFSDTAENADFSFTVPDIDEKPNSAAIASKTIINPAPEPLAFESLNPSRRRSIVPPSPFAEALFSDDRETKPVVNEVPNVFIARARSISDEEKSSSPESLNSPLRSYSAPKTPKMDRKDSPKPMGSPLLTRTLRQQLELNLRKEMETPLKQQSTRSLSRSPDVSPQKIKELLRRKSSIKTSPTKSQLLRTEHDLNGALETPAVFEQHVDTADQTPAQLLVKLAVHTTLFILLSLGLSLAFWFFKEGHSIQYCGDISAELNGSLSTESAIISSCVPCPSHFRCINGHIVSCINSSEKIRSLPLFGPLGVFLGLNGSCGLHGETFHDPASFEDYAHEILESLSIAVSNLASTTIVYIDMASDAMWRGVSPAFTYLDSLGVDETTAMLSLATITSLSALAILLFLFSRNRDVAEDLEEEISNVDSIAGEIIERLRQIGDRSMVRVDQLRDAFLPLHNLPSSCICWFDVAKSMAVGGNSGDFARERMWGDICHVVREMGGVELQESVEDACLVWSWNAVEEENAEKTCDAIGSQAPVSMDC